MRCLAASTGSGVRSGCNSSGVIAAKRPCSKRCRADFHNARKAGGGAAVTALSRRIDDIDERLKVVETGVGLRPIQP